ncbi:MAG: HAD family hydrolase [Lachnospiraceae bacterium]|jgi:putative hydrolase of the HAD superfamily|nr:HAD family hydrolase [Lachnospiraceae bacterium]
MAYDIKAVFFDLGNTLRILHKDADYQKEAKEKFAKLSGTDLTPDEFIEMINYRYQGYRKWCFNTEKEATEEDLFSKWLLPEYPRDEVLKNAKEMAYLYRQTEGKRLVVPSAPAVIDELKNRGYSLGIISNLVTSIEVPEWLSSSGLGSYFDPVILSCVCGLRKPGIEIFKLAEKLSGIPLSQVAFVGDNIDRDIPGSRQAGCGLNILYITPEKLSKHPMTDENRPDAVIHRLVELLELLPKVGQVNEEFMITENK